MSVEFLREARHVAHLAYDFGNRWLEFHRWQGTPAAKLDYPPPREFPFRSELDGLYKALKEVPHVTSPRYRPVLGRLCAVRDLVLRLRDCILGNAPMLGPEFCSAARALSEAVQNTTPEPPECLTWMDKAGADAMAAFAKQLWESDPVQVFELLRDRVCEALAIVVNVHGETVSEGADFRFGELKQAVQHALDNALGEAQALWRETPVARYLERAGPTVTLDGVETRNIPGVKGSCYHDLAMALADGLREAIKLSMSAKEYARMMRFYTAAGDLVSQHLASLVPEIRCECQQGVAKWRSKTEARNVPTIGRTERPAKHTTPPIRKDRHEESRTVGINNITPDDNVPSATYIERLEQRKVRHARQTEEAGRKAASFDRLNRTWYEFQNLSSSGAGTDEFADLASHLCDLVEALKEAGYGERLDELKAGDDEDRNFAIDLYRRAKHREKIPSIAEDLKVIQDKGPQVFGGLQHWFFRGLVEEIRRTERGNEGAEQGEQAARAIREPETSEGQARTPKATKGKRIDERMLAAIRDDNDAIYWSANCWATHLKCAKSTVLGTPTWDKFCKPARERERLANGRRLRGPKKPRFRPTEE